MQRTGMAETSKQATNMTSIYSSTEEPYNFEHMGKHQMYVRIRRQLRK